jgi:phosphocarrier protein HPr
MATATVHIVNNRGLHARASGKLAALAGKFKAVVTVEKDGVTVPATSIMGLLLLGASKGHHVMIHTDGVEAEKALEALCALVADKFGEGS